MTKSPLLGSSRVSLENGPGDVRLARPNVHYQARGEEVCFSLNALIVFLQGSLGVPPGGQLLEPANNDKGPI